MLLLSLGAGVQSSTLALMAACGELTPMPDHAIFADTQDEPADVYHWLDWLEPRLPFPVHRVTQGKLSDDVVRMRVTFDGRKYSRTAVPFFTECQNTGERGMIRMRSCTRDFKIRPILKKARELIGAKLIAAWWRDYRKSGNTLEALATQWIGISLDEHGRMKHSRDPWVRCAWPLIERRMTRHSCLEWLKAHGFPSPPRSACVFCPFHSDAEWRRLKTEQPAEFDKAIAFERAVQIAKGTSDNLASKPFLHRSCKPLDQVDFSDDFDRGQLSLWNDECDGICGV